MAEVGIYKRILPSPPAIEFASPEGKQLFLEAIQSGTMEGFFNLISYFQTQSEPAYCGLASISMVLNALAIDPRRKWKGPWRWFDESMLDCCEPLGKIKAEGITFAKVACLATCNGAKVKALRTNQCTMDGFRKYVIECTSTDGCHVIVSYHRKTFKQTGGGHFSPIGGYHVGRDMVLILDVARFKYPPHWVPLSLMWEAMDTIDESTGLQRGFMVMSRPQTATSLLYTLSCKHDNWASTAKQLIDDVPVLLKSDDIKDFQNVLSVIFTSLPTNFVELIKWVVEIRREEDNGSSLSKEEKGRLNVKEEVLKQVKETRLFKHVTDWLSFTSSSDNNIPVMGDQSIAFETPAFAFIHGAKALPMKLELLDTSADGLTSVRCLNANCEMPSTELKASSEQEIDMLVPSNETSTSLNSVASDGLTALLLALPPRTWLGIKDEKLLEEVCSLVSTESLPPLLREEVLYLRRQLHFLRKCLDDELPHQEDVQ